MLKKKLVVTMASVAAASFILGTMFNLNLITTAKQDDGGMPVWDVTVTNWPVSTSVNVWWREHIDHGAVASRAYNRSGFSQLHVLVHSHGLEITQTARILIYGLLWNGTHTSFHTPLVAEITLDHYNPDAVMTIPVPSDQFLFTVGSDYECDVSLSFYLTWA